MARDGTNRGRPPGSRNKRTKAQAEAVTASGLTPLDYMLSVMRDVNADPVMRLDAAKSAANYVHSKLTSVDVNANVEGSLTVTVLKGL